MTDLPEVRWRELTPHEAELVAPGVMRIEVETPNQILHDMPWKAIEPIMPKAPHTQLLTNSRAACFRRCPREHYLRFELGLAPEEESLALRVGRVYHLLQELVDGGAHPEQVMDDIVDLDPYEKSLVAAMYQVHSERYRNDEPHEIVATEMSFELPLRNPASGKMSRVWRKAGVIDKVYRIGDRLWIKDYKTTTEDISPGSDFWVRLMLDQQLSIYVVAARELGYDVVGILYDVAVRPMHSPKMMTPVADRKYTQKASKAKDGTVRPAGSLYAGQREVDETPEEFAARVANALREEPERFYACHEIARTDGDLEDVEAEVWMQQLTIREAQRSGRWFRSPSACTGFYRCPYLSICGQNHTQGTAVPPDFKRLADVHPELSRTQEQLTPPSGG